MNSTSLNRCLQRITTSIFLLILLAGVVNPLRLYAQTTSVAFPGNFGQAIGAPSWDPADPAIQASDEDGDGVWELSVILPRGDFEFKVAFDGDWPGNLGMGGEVDGENIPISIPESSTVTFAWDSADNNIRVTLEGENITGENVIVENGIPVGVAGEEETAHTVGDGEIVSAALAHDSRSDAFRNPGGAQPAGSTVVLRLRTAANDVDGVRILLTDGIAQVISTVPMTLVASDEISAWWEAQVTLGDAPTAYAYAFEVRDGDTVRYVVDTANLDGGTGAVLDAFPGSGYGWNIYAYDPAFETPEWAANAIIYQIFPDRFRNGDPTNDPPADAFGYPEERGEIFPIAPWNTIVPDPDPADSVANPDWYSTWNSTFYGGDLQGVLEKLDYLQALGVDTIYFTPVVEAATNHRYDSIDPRLVDDNLAVIDDHEASMAYFEEFAAEIEARGMHLILDGVPNHTSSNSPYFDLYGNWETEGACESVKSPYRGRYIFTDATNPASAPCDGGQGYRAFAGVTTLPQQDTTAESVLDDWLDPDTGVASFWLNIPGVDGWRIDTVVDVASVNSTFFQPFRTVTKAANPDALLISETWKESDVFPHVLGNEFDSTMNYRFANAVLGFLRDTPFTDTNDGDIYPLTASEFEASLRAIQEDYPPQAFATAMNLIDSHDVNRAVRVLDNDGVDYATLEPVNGFEDGRARLRLASALQYTLPGAPTVFYGDEVGLVGFGSDPKRDDPHNRQPYPWDDLEGYDELPSWRQADGDLLAHYQKLGALRNEYSFLRTGDWQTLLVDDTGVLVYGRSDESGAAIIAINRSDAEKEVAVNLTGFAPPASTWIDVYGEGETLSSAAAMATLAVPVDALDFRILVVEEAFAAPSNAPTLEGVANNGSTTLTVASEGSDGDDIVLYRSRVDGGYEPVGAAAWAESVVFTDTDVSNGRAYFYVARLRNADLLESPNSNVVRLVPAAQIESATLLEPAEVEHPISAITPTVALNAAVLIPGESEAEGPTTGLLAEIGSVWLSDAGMAMFIWHPAEYAGESDEGELYTATLLPELAGDYSYRFRFSADQGATWTESDSGAMTVVPAEDQEAPKAPFRMDEVARGADKLTFAWRLSRPRDLAFFRICRTDLTAEEADCATQFTTPGSSNIFTDTNVITGHTYQYTVRVVDESFNISEPSAPIDLKAEQTAALVTFRVLAPPDTPADTQLYIAGDNPDVFGAPWDPGRIPMTNMGDGIWEWQVTLLDGQLLLYKYTRGSWEQVEQWGAVAGMGNRGVTIFRQDDGTFLVDDTATDWGAGGPDDHRAIQFWRDPLVRTAEPAPDSVGAVGSVRVDFATPVSGDPATAFVVADEGANPIAGAVTKEGTNSFLFTPEAPFAPGVYTATAFNVQTDVPMLAPYQWSFTVE